MKNRVSKENKKDLNLVNKLDRVTVKNVGKLFGKNLNRNRKIIASNMVNSFFNSNRQYHKTNEDFWALKNININISHGESVALLGNNGAGKSTLLKIMSGHLLPTEGIITTIGNVSELTAMSAGYQANLTGRENIFLAGALRGFKKTEISDILEDIIDFSEIREFIDSPFGTYSAGMKMRLAFSVVAHASPDILFIDEALAVGDIRFRNKCLGRLHSMKKNTTFILVTHSLSSVSDFCDRVIVIDRGSIVFDGDSKNGILAYKELNESRNVGAKTGPELNNPDKISIVNANWINASNQKTDVYEANSNWTFKFTAIIEKPILEAQVSIMLYDMSGNEIVTFSDPINPGLNLLKKKGKYEITTNVRNPRLQGSFTTVLAIRNGPELIYRKGFKSIRTLPESARTWGVIKINSECEINPI